MVDIFNEVEEDLRRDRLLTLWRRHGTTLIVAAVVLVVATGGISIWRSWQARHLAAASDAFAKASELDATGKHKEAADAYAAIAADAPGGYPLLAKLRAASAQLAAGDAPAALSSLDAAAAGGGDSMLRDLAALKAAAIALDLSGPDEAGRRLEPLAAEGRPWRQSARELQAVIALKQGRIEDSRSILTDLAADSSAPEGLRGRAAEILESLGPAPAAPAAAPAPAAPAK